MKGQPGLSIFPHSFTMCSAGAGEVSRRWYQLSGGWLCDELLPTRCTTAENVSPCIFWIKQLFVMIPHCDTSAASLQFFLLPTNVRDRPTMKNDKSIKVVGTLCKIGKQTILKTRLEAWLHNVHHEKRSWDMSSWVWSQSGGCWKITYHWLVYHLVKQMTSLLHNPLNVRDRFVWLLGVVTWLWQVLLLHTVIRCGVNGAISSSATHHHSCSQCGMVAHYSPGHHTHCTVHILRR